MDEMMDYAQKSDPNYKYSNLHNFFWIDCPKAVDYEKLMEALAKLKNVQAVYEQGQSTLPSTVNAVNDPKAQKQNYLDAAPAGIDARFAWKQPGGDGSGPVIFIDIEHGWDLPHEDFPPAGSQNEIKLKSGVNKEDQAHGTAVLGEILAQDNDLGCVGITPAGKAILVSSYRSQGDNDTNVPDAVLTAIDLLGFGDVLLIEEQKTLSNGRVVVPIETDLAVFDAICIGITRGITVIEPAGNGNNDLDNYKYSHKAGEPKEFFLKRGDTTIAGDLSFKDSGAIMVGAASSRWRKRLGSSNHGSRIDCYARGKNLTTTGNYDESPAALYTSKFGGTSGASAIIAGAAIAVQSMVHAAGKNRLTPPQLRKILSNPDTGTNSHDPLLDKIGVMPDLKQIFQKFIDVA
jgi:hypothetical protein